MAPADLVIVNMCSVRQQSVNRVYGKYEKFIKIKKSRQELITMLTGCVSKKDRIKFLKKFDIVIDIKDILSLPKLLGETRKKIGENYLTITPAYQNKFSANVPIMTGCNNFCAYCVVPYSRGKEISRPTEEILREVEKLVKNGYKEIWLLGQNVNSYKSQSPVADGRSNPKSQTKKTQTISFPELLKMVNNISGEFWIRFTSSHPKDFSGGLINAMAKCEKATKYLNLPIQSGDDKILKKMNRPYTSAGYKRLVAKIREKMPEIALSTDIIVGFPGEAKEQFENSVKIFKEIAFDMAHIAKYSPRPGTAAEKMKDNISLKEKSQREKILTDILRQTALTHNKKLIGKEITVLVDSEKNGFYFGKSEGYKTVKIVQNFKLKNQNRSQKPKAQKQVGKFVKVKVIGATSWGLSGDLIL